ncbi:mechanosensitive ion channel [Kingella negevensis]|uniref:Putative MscS family protein.1 n=1 Tax=Kingella negevensis TaxID=1522312 RepID=A0A238TFD5_9NEIS|nr:mechanosensitive ion channel domain-containing protein [Kingella negevensis]MDK4680198.1 mechanosensitive ion channel [Kingella negevensis]MDK4682082.1 mechanosensitive ion channel [Kingella negevensis]MDK4690278.1 mechanosensitive ion channel [Kingella negevensis]MDK4692376.1 mechanosensitive ion channel [Kingella negevensis]MDK4696515.1 mechanosensitive ion channel [Kingella negevensis]
MIELKPIDWNDFFNTLHLFAPKEFTARLLERSFRQPEGWVELGLVLAIMAASFFIAKQAEKSQRIKNIKFRPIRHSLRRVIFPVIMLMFSVVALLLWRVFGQTGVWLRLLVLAAHWMVMIRFCLALLHTVLPKTTWSDSLERKAATALWLYFVLWVSGIDDLIINWMRSLEFTIGKSRLNLFTLLTGLIWVGIVMMFMMWLARWINAQIMSSTRLDVNLRIVLSKVIKTLLMILSVLIALPLVGIDLTVLSVFGGALGVGLGFGLQKIASNYVSGFIILADRSIRPGDRLTVNNFTGYVTEITSRFVVLRSSAGQEALIPNETFVTSTVINESYTGKALYQSLDIQVAYHTDLTLALRILQEAAAEQERVGKDPSPSAVLTNFGENGIDLRVGFWVNDPENGFAGLFSAILLTIWRRFNEEGIEFPYPQREVRILNDEQSPSDIALLKAKIRAKQDTKSQEPLEDDD